MSWKRYYNAAIGLIVIALLLLALLAGLLVRSSINRPAAPPHAIVVQGWDDNYAQDGAGTLRPGHPQ